MLSPTVTSLVRCVIWWITIVPDLRQPLRLPGDRPAHKPYNNSRPRYHYARGEISMGKAIECIYENNVLKPVGKVPFREGERIRITVEKKLPFDPIQLKKKPSSARISSLKDESWTSS
jgi:predicted DNA-binding antitoxin AbrB/MazE fold protein